MPITTETATAISKYVDHTYPERRCYLILTLTNQLEVILLDSSVIVVQLNHIPGVKERKE